MATSPSALWVEWTRLERLLAVVCAASPLVMWVIDSDPLRESISAYYGMVDNQWFYVPLAVAAMLFVVNGTTKKQHRYNWVLGAALIGVLMFNTDSYTVIHTLFAIVFFAGNVAVMAFWSDAPARFRYPFVLVVVAVGAITWFTGVLTVWWAEYVSLVVIAAHFLLDSLDGRRWDWYKSLPPEVNPWSRGTATGQGAQLA